MFKDCVTRQEFDDLKSYHFEIHAMLLQLIDAVGYDIVPNPNQRKWKVIKKEGK